MRDAKRIVVVGFSILLPSGKRLHNYGKKDPPFFMGKFTINGDFP
jgi:hypothetical protein